MATAITRSDLLDRCLDIAHTYDGNLTVRQLYYRLVAEATIGNGQREYKRIVATLSKARLDGTFPFEYLLDRTREVRPGNFTRNEVDVDDAINSGLHAVEYNFPHWYIHNDRWLNQPKFVSVWVEKEALAGVFQEPCEALGVSWFVARGYPSVSALNDWVNTYRRVCVASETTPTPVILYFGDHDPDGLEIPHAAIRNIHRIMDIRGLDLPRVKLVNCALTLDQISEHNPPPFPAKTSSSRFRSYVEVTGLTSAWELDALPPDMLDKIIRENVKSHFVEEIHRRNQAEVAEAREDFRLMFPQALMDTMS